ncbi:MAG: gliding motility-associated C-terminal domain-containing protein, partial [Bacteroidota bacterium]
SVNVFVSDDFEIFVPDLFSPNGDNMNDLLLVNTLGVEQLEFNIYDRKGREMFTTNDKDMGWDGTFNGSEQPMDNYIYFIIAELSSGERVSRKGSVQLIR